MSKQGTEIKCITYPEFTELSTSGQERRLLQKAIVGFSTSCGWRGIRKEPPRRGGALGARQSSVRLRELSADAPSVGNTRGNPATKKKNVYSKTKCFPDKIWRTSHTIAQTLTRLYFLCNMVLSTYLGIYCVYIGCNYELNQEAYRLQLWRLQVPAFHKCTMFLFV